jgi:hypothetical protein
MLDDNSVAPEDEYQVVDTVRDTFLAQSKSVRAMIRWASGESAWGTCCG